MGLHREEAASETAALQVMNTMTDVSRALVRTHEMSQHLSSELSGAVQ